LAWYELEPVGDVRADWHAAQVVHAIERVFGGQKRAKVKDYLLRFGPREQQTPRQVAAHVRSWLRTQHMAETG